MRARRRGWAGVLLAGVSGVATLGPVLWITAAPAFAFAQRVDIVNFTYSPATATIKPGDKIIWLNNSNTKHTVTSDDGGADFDYTIAPGREEELRFEKAGTYTYHCKFHNQMTGTIEVGDSPPTTAPAPPPTTTTTTAPPATTTTAPATTTTAEPTTTTTAPRPAAGPGPSPLPVPSAAAAPPPTASSTTTSAPSTTTTTTAPPTTATSAPPTLAGGDEPAASVPSSAGVTPPSSAEQPKNSGNAIPAAAGPHAAGGDVDVAAVGLVSALVAVGAFGAWTLIRIRPGRI